MKERTLGTLAKGSGMPDAASLSSRRKFARTPGP